jgi:hypothetical protein
MRRFMNSSSVITSCVVPSRQGGHYFEPHDSAGRVM